VIPDVMPIELDCLTLERVGGVGVVTLTRPDEMNVIGDGFVHDLETLLDRIEHDPEIRVVVVTGGPDVFIAGGDVAALAAAESPAAIRPLVSRMNRVHDRIEHMDRPFIAAMAGVALGGGCEFALACDVRIAADNLRIGLPEIHLGLLPGSGGTQRLPRLIGTGRAKELLLTGRIVDAYEAERIGLVNEVVSAATLLDTAMARAEELAARPPIAVGMVKSLVVDGMNVDLRTGIELEQRSFETLFSTRDRREGVRAFLEKRRPEFNGT